MANEREVRIEGRCVNQAVAAPERCDSGNTGGAGRVAQDLQVETITVTGSRIPRADSPPTAR